jgi:hypothetical protein
MPLLRRTAIWGFALVFMGCRSEGEPPASAAGEWLAPADSVVLVEENEFELGDPYGFAVDAQTGDFLLADRFADQIVRFDSLGRPRSTYGGPGGGPGEFRGLTHVFVHQGEVLGVDGQRFLIWVFDGESGRLKQEIRTTGVVSDAVWSGDSLLLAAPVFDATSSIELVRPDSGHERFGPVPAPLRENPMYFGFNAATFLAPAGPGRLYLAFAGRNEVYVVEGGQPVDTLDVPRRSRRGVPSDIVERMREARSVKERGESHSQILAVHALAPDRLAVVHADHYLTGSPPAVKVTADVFLTVVHPDAPTEVGGCVDLGIPVADLARPRVAFQGETLYVLDRRLANGAMQTRVLRFPLGGLSCE